MSALNKLNQRAQNFSSGTFQNFMDSLPKKTAEK